MSGKSRPDSNLVSRGIPKILIGWTLYMRADDQKAQMLNFVIAHLLQLVFEHGVLLVCSQVLVTVAVWLDFLRRNRRRDAWRDKVVFAALVACTAAVVLDGGVTLAMSHVPSVTNPIVIALLLMGILSFAGIVGAIMGKGRPRISAAIVSCWLFVVFGIKMLMAINSFH